jgi:diadenosine tetraphosphatase ApaH/serine/threonine PP2A family protein phosphatase
MRYAIFTDIHANLEALEAVLTRIDELAKEKPIDQIWFLGDLVGYGPNPNECIAKVRERTNVLIAGNHDWAAVGKIDLEDFSAAARISAEWTAEQLTEEHRTFLINLPERLEIDDCTLVHGSPYGPLWEYLTSEVLAERSFQYFSSRYCFVGHTHVPVIFQQPDTIANAPTLPLVESEQNGVAYSFAGEDEDYSGDPDDETAEIVVIQPPISTTMAPGQAESAYADPETGQAVNEADANTMLEAHMKTPDQPLVTEAAAPEQINTAGDEDATTAEESAATEEVSPQPPETSAIEEDATTQEENSQAESLDNTVEYHDAAEDQATPKEAGVQEALDNEEAPEVTEPENAFEGESTEDDGETKPADSTTPEAVILNAEDRLSSEIEELLTLLGLSESMIQVSNEMLVPPEGHWKAAEGYRAIINPGGVGQPRDGDPRAALMIYDTEEGFEFYRIPYEISKTQEKILKAGLPQYLAIRLAYGR